MTVVSCSSRGPHEGEVDLLDIVPTWGRWLFLRNGSYRLGFHKNRRGAPAIGTRGEGVAGGKGAGGPAKGRRSASRANGGTKPRYATRRVMVRRDRAEARREGAPRPRGPALLSLPEPLEPPAGDPRVVDGVPGVAMPEIVLHRAEVGALVGEVVAA